MSFWGKIEAITPFVGQVWLKMPTKKQHRCKGKTLRGLCCKRSRVHHSDFCLAHQPVSVEAADVLVPSPQPQPPLTVTYPQKNSLQEFQTFIYEQEWKSFQGLPAYTYDDYEQLFRQ